MKTTYIFGAGASAGSDFKLPCMKGFFDKGISQHKYPNLWKFINIYFEGTSLDNLNLEDVITTLDLGSDQFGKFNNTIDPLFYSAKNEFNEYILNRLDYLTLDGGKYCRQHLKLLNSLKMEDSIITLNYDLVLEWSLIEAQKSYKKGERILDRLVTALNSSTHYWGGPLPVLPRKYIEKGHFLKLHGSLNWYYCPREGCLHNQAFYTTLRDDTIEDLPIKQPCQACGEKLERVIVPPTMGKVFKRFPKMGFIWSLAHQEISSSQRIVIIGVSLADSDYYFRWLLRSALLKSGLKNRMYNIYVVNPNVNDRNKLTSLFGKTLFQENCFDSLNDYNEWEEQSGRVTVSFKG